MASRVVRFSLRRAPSRFLSTTSAPLPPRPIAGSSQDAPLHVVGTVLLDSKAVPVWKFWQQNTNAFGAWAITSILKVAGVVLTGCLGVWGLDRMIKGSKPIVAFDNSLDDVKADAKGNRESTIDVTVHKPVVDELKRKLDDPKFMKAIVVRGPKNAGKSWTTRFALDACDPDKLHVVWVKANNITSVSELADDLENAMGIKWHDSDARSLLIEKLFPPETTSATLTTRPLNDEHRLRRVLDILQEQARMCKAESKKCIVLLDDFETAETAEDTRSLNKAFRTVANTLAGYAKNNILQPVIVSSDPNISRYFPHRHDGEVVVGWLSKADVRKYVEAFCGGNRDQEEIDDITTAVINNAGRLVYHVREACDAIKDLPKGTDVKRIIKDVADITAHKDFVEIQTTVRQLGQEAAVWQAIKAWRAHAVQGEDGQFEIPPRVADTFSREALEGVEILIRGGVLYDAGNGAIKEVSLSHRNVMDRLASMFAPPRSGWYSWLFG
ncbi:hypothetical protein PTSG_12572 [Salpingoeca rosetta]|uniref:Uncharacterized protein n=1 Tax=Salpingoeca rosetta (strain ATCC 50818 / BSB-021) TaxID=946362 RepID=F2UJ43_SALR5|nr:uncharacterized protein PTSG_12572 [Salpingoeca rosetta]EGD76991.1 hypothetical protein PTSG_12572 [Salpingoeca rosetta]|eukprot:XP_004990831.1 hypothetical protein PTSG_12572 [Salpingoeca rosetta]